MSIMFAQGATESAQSNNGLMIIIGFLTLIFKDIGKWVADWFKDKKEERQQQADREAKAQTDALLQHTLDGILNSNEAKVKLMQELKSASEKSHALDRMRFEVLNGKADKSACKADCPIDQRKYKVIPQ